MAGVFLWSEALAGLHALYEMVTAGAGYADAYRRQRADGRTLQEAEFARTRLSTYSDREVQDLIRRIEGCRDRFIKQGSGRGRASCLCSILNEIREGKGGMLPPIDSWQDMYDQLQCSSY